MKNIIIPSAALIAAVISIESCTKQEIADPVVPRPAPAVADAQTYSLSVNLNVGEQVRTKASKEAAIDTVRSVQIFVFDESRKDSIETYFYKMTKVGQPAASDSLRLTAGKKKIRVLANAPEIGGKIGCLKDLEACTCEFGINTTESFVMSGGKEMELTKDSSVEVTVNRIVAKIVLKKLTVDFDAEVYDKMTFTLKDIYLTNVAYCAKYYGGEYVPGQGQEAQTWKNGLEYALTKETGLNVGLSYDDEVAYDVDHIFYCYPNSDKNHPTRLVLKTSLDKATYYYPIEIGAIESNKVYTITDLKITRPGSDDPDVPVISQMFPYNITVGDWDDDVNEIQEII